MWSISYFFVVNVKIFNAPVVTRAHYTPKHTQHSLIIIVCWLHWVHVLNCIHPTGGKRNKPTTLCFLFPFRLDMLFSFRNMFYYNSLQRNDVMINTKCSNKNEIRTQIRSMSIWLIAFFLFEFLYTHDMLRLEAKWNDQGKNALNIRLVFDWLRTKATTTSN